MAKDFARAPAHRAGRGPQPQRHSARGPFLAGLGLGLGVAVLVWLVDHGHLSLAGLWPGSGQAPRQATPAASAPAALPRFDFYTILPEMEVVIPEENAQPAAAAAARPAPAPPPAAASVPPPLPVDGAGSYILQAGSFRSVADAEALKASLALLGYQASVQRVTVNQDTYHRVRLGPYRDQAAANAVRARLHDNAVQTMLLRLKG
ncbi:MAG TPA: SPOR domain-containing protein [Gammaproteobacteria bacterium]